MKLRNEHLIIEYLTINCLAIVAPATAISNTRRASIVANEKCKHVLAR